MTENFKKNIILIDLEWYIPCLWQATQKLIIQLGKVHLLKKGGSEKKEVYQKGGVSKV